MFEQKIADYIVSNPYPPRERTNNRHWPSEASCVNNNGIVVGKCLREQYFIRKKYPVSRVSAAHHIRKMNIGKAIEQKEIEYAKEVGIWVEDDVPFMLDMGDITISGKLDAIYRDDDGNIICVEYKTSVGYFFEKEVYGKYSSHKAFPKPEHILQVMLYLEAFKHIPYAIIFYINRSKMDVIEHRVELCDGVGMVNGEPTGFTLNKIYDRYREVTRCLDADEIPQRDYCPAYPPAEIENLYSTNKISKKAFDLWLNDDILPGHWRCASMCGFKDTCIAIEQRSCSGAGNTANNKASGAIIEL